MSLKITDECVNCDVCEPACPNNAIYFDEEKNYYQIIPDKCTECVGHFDEPQCSALCPVDDCILQGQEESKEQLLAKYHKLTFL
jgi:ferredoxin